MTDKYVNYWATVANRLSPNKYVVGFDPLNEPLPAWTGIMQAIYEITFGHYDSTELTPLYTKVFEKYMDANKENLMFFEPGQFPDTLPIGPEG